MHEVKINSVMPSSLSIENWLRLACASWSNRLAVLLAEVLTEHSGHIHKGIQFLIERSTDDLAQLGWGKFPNTKNSLIDLLPKNSNLGRLVDNYAWSASDLDLVILAGLPEIHEGYADLLRLVNPEKKPRMATGLAAQLLGNFYSRKTCENSLLLGSAMSHGALQLEGEGPLYTRHLLLADGLWPIINNIDLWPKQLAGKYANLVSWGLESWLKEESCKKAQTCLLGNENILIRLHAPDLNTAINRANTLVDSVQGKSRVFYINEKTPESVFQLIYLHCTARGIVPILSIENTYSERPLTLKIANNFKGCLLVVSNHHEACQVADKPLVNIYIDKLDNIDHQKIWQLALPNLKNHAHTLAARFPIEPHAAAEIANDLKYLKTITPADVGQQIRARAGDVSKAGIKLVTPTASWEDLVLSDKQASQLRESVERLSLQDKVLNQWGFLKSRSGSRGVKLLLAGPPGTGKTLSAEVLAHALGVDLLIIDISRVVSKWKGETEKNLEQAFQAAEQSKAVLLFDEADALFGKRTEVNDSNDRSANLETAFLLTRLERFEGLAVMSTNLRNNIDSAFLRRIEYIIDFDEPSRDERTAIWRCHVPAQAPLDTDVDFVEISAMFPVVGGIIRNAAVTAAYRAAAQNRSLCRNDFIHALRREYDKQGKAFPAISRE